MFPIKKLGFTAVWVTPLVVQQKPTPGGAGSGAAGTSTLSVPPSDFGVHDARKFASATLATPAPASLRKSRRDTRTELRFVLMVSPHLFWIKITIRFY